MDKEKERLFGEFPPVSAESWKEKIVEDLKGADYDKKMIWRTGEGFNVNPFYRKEVRDQTFVDHTDNLFHINQPHEFENYTTENNYDSKEIFRVVHSLPRDYRIPFLMHLSGFKYREIADRLGLPLGTVKSRIFFTRQQLQRMLKDYR